MAQIDDFALSNSILLQLALTTSSLVVLKVGHMAASFGMTRQRSNVAGNFFIAVLTMSFSNNRDKNSHVHCIFHTMQKIITYTI